MGFCPVILREDRDLADMSEDHEARFGLNTYHFSSAEACDRFKANPTRYAPAAGGADVVALVNSGEQHAGSLEFAMWYRDRLYLFCSQETAGLFRADPASFGDQY
jgi:YHS domain-containing protein